MLQLLLFTVLGLFPIQTSPPHPPGQPQRGPGGSEYAHRAVSVRLVEGGWIFTPAEPEGSKSEWIVLLGDRGVIDPRFYGAWIDHLARRGNRVLFPMETASLEELADLIRRSLALGARDPRPDEPALSPAPVVLAGHGTGGTLAAELAARSGALDMPPVAALLCAMPSFRGSVAPEVDLADVPPTTRLLVLTGDADSVAEGDAARRIYVETTGVGMDRKALVLVQSDGHGEPPLTANHPLPIAYDARYANEGLLAGPPDRRGTDALDHRVLWKLFDQLCDAAFRDAPLPWASGGRLAGDVGRWSDGHAIAPWILRSGSDS